MTNNITTNNSFWSKIKKNLGKIKFAKDIITMWFCMKDSATPAWVKAQIASAIAYFISPIDAIPDAIPIAGYADDAAVIAACLAIVQSYITCHHRKKADHFFK